LCGAVVVVSVPLLNGFVVEELPDSLPQPATATVLARVAASVSMAVSGVLFIGRAPIVARGLAGSPYQPSETPIAVV
jgi:hypothetical protein